MFSNLRLYRIEPDFFQSMTAASLADALGKSPYLPCAPTQEKSFGWVPPRGIEHAPLVEIQDGKHWLCTARFQTKSVPRSFIAEKVDELAKKIEEATGRKPGGKARKELAEQAKHEALPNAFPKTSSVRVWFSVEHLMLCIDAGSSGAADEVITALINAAPDLKVQAVQTAESPAACMAAWLLDGVTPENFQIDRACELRGSDEQRAKVRYANHPLDIDEVKAHLVSGKMPTWLAMSWSERVSFELTEGLVVRKIKFLDLAFEGRAVAASDEAFDADFALAAGQLSGMLPALIAGLGGLLDLGLAGPADPPVSAASGLDGTEHELPETREADRAAAMEPLPEGQDPLLESAVIAIRGLSRVSASVLQAKLDVPATRAEGLLHALERVGQVSAASPGGNRTVLPALPHAA